ncbi:MAG: hypothetical protein M1821_009877 [Bathelium mastoideum]|nr:MAG: hypothetical protein M1821_009877 [Bathelium mastoideum]KAI9690363.1 MAG: hypothetical protein M1822_009325 [Bathelium mastoideum]
MAMHNSIPDSARHSREQLGPNGEASEDVACPIIPLSANGFDLSPSVSTHDTNEANHKDDDLQNHWQKVMCDYMNIPSGYLEVVVLLIRWDDELDELKCAGQVNELRRVFQEEFNFTTELIKLHGQFKVQHQLTNALSNFLGKYDKPHNLVIVYYTGHGVFDTTSGHLELAAFEEPQNHPAGNLARASWTTAEQSLIQGVDCDVLSILDCCFASDTSSNTKEKHKRERVITKYFESLMPRDEGPDLPIYELLAASGPGLPTPSEPEHSFTGKLIKALKKLSELKEPFSTHALNEQIIKQSMGETISCLFNRSPRSHPNGRHISLSYLERSLKRQNSFTTDPIKSYLTLKFALKTDSLTKSQLKNLAKKLSEACKEGGSSDKEAAVGVRSIDWISLHNATGHQDFRRAVTAIRSLRRWRSHTVSRRGGGGGGGGEEATPSPSPGPSPSPSPDPSPKSELPRIMVIPSKGPERLESVHEVKVTPSRLFALLSFTSGVVISLTAAAAFSFFRSGLGRSSEL